MLVFGISKAGQLLNKIENDSFPVFTVLPRPADQLKMSYRMNFNPSALRVMLNDKWTIGQEVNEETGVTRTFFVNLVNIPVGVVPNISFEVCNNGNVNNQKLWKHLREILNSDNELLKFKLVTTEIEGINVLVFEAYDVVAPARPDVVLTDAAVHEELMMEEATAVEEVEETTDAITPAEPVWGIQ